MEPTPAPAGAAPRTIRCMFRVQGIERVDTGGGQEGEVLRTHVVCDPAGLYKSFFRATPSGELKIQTLQPTGFRPGQTLQVDITPVD